MSDRHYTIKECEEIFKDEINNDDIYAIGMWGVNPQVLEYPVKSASFDADKLMKRAEENAHDFFNRIGEILI